VSAPLIGMIVGIALLRFGWGGAKGAGVAGWTLVAATLVGGGRHDGAWGVALVALAGMATALAILLWAGWTSPARKRRPVREATSGSGGSLARGWPDLGRRIAVFVLAVPVAFGAALWLAFACQAGARRLGAGEADATALTLMLQPVLWCAIMCWQMTRAGPGRMIAPPAAAALVGAAIWSVS